MVRINRATRLLPDLLSLGWSVGSNNNQGPSHQAIVNPQELSGELRDTCINPPRFYPRKSSLRLYKRYSYLQYETWISQGQRGTPVLRSPGCGVEGDETNQGK